jgi:isopenicillin-N N-acyltransferase like protein
MATPLHLIDISGSPRERGRLYGETARDHIARSIDFYRALFEQSSGRTWADAQVIASRWIPAIDAYLPDILDEMRGIAEGAGRAFEEILALNARGEVSSAARQLEAGRGCTTYAVTDEAAGDGHVYCGQNWDYREAVADTIVVLRVRQPPKPTVIMYTEAGQVARHGANSAGLALNANGLGLDARSAASFGTRPGAAVPFTFILRRVLDAPTMFEALQAVADAAPRASGNLLLTHREGVVIDLEVTPDRFQWLYPTDGRLVHGNHFSAPLLPQMAGTYQPPSVDSLYRVPRVERVLKRSREATCSEQMVSLIATALRDHFGYPKAVCDHPDEREAVAHRTQTVTSSIVDLTSGEFRLAPGPPCESEYEVLPWNLYDAEAARSS